MLPGLNGVEVLRRFSRHLKNTRVLVFSGFQNPTLVRELLQAGAHGFVEKSARLSELRKGIQTVAEGGTYFGPVIASLLRETVVNPAPVRTARASNPSPPANAKFSSSSPKVSAPRKSPPNSTSASKPPKITAPT